MSRVTSIDKHQDHHTNPSNNTLDLVVPTPNLTDENNRSVLNTTIKEVNRSLCDPNSSSLEGKAYGLFCGSLSEVYDF